MGKLIDEQTAYDVLTDYYHHSTDTQRQALMDALSRVPTVDAVEVVRCRDCRWWHDWSGECYAKEAQGFGHLWEADDYCSFGEWKDGEQQWIN